MAVDYASVAVKALAGIQKAGQAMVITRMEGGSWDESAGSFTGRTAASYPCWGMYLRPSQGDRWYSGTQVQAGDRYFLLAASGMEVTPQPGDLLEDYNVVAVVPVAPGGVDLLYRVLGRR